MSEDLQSRFQSQFEVVIEEVLTALDRVNVFYEAISKHNLNPSSAMYFIPGDMNIDKERFLSWVKLLAAAVAYFSMILFVTCIVVLVRAGLFRSPEVPEEATS